MNSSLKVANKVRKYCFLIKKQMKTKSKGIKHKKGSNFLPPSLGSMLSTKSKKDVIVTKSSIGFFPSRKVKIWSA